MQGIVTSYALTGLHYLKGKKVQRMSLTIHMINLFIQSTHGLALRKNGIPNTISNIQSITLNYYAALS